MKTFEQFMADLNENTNSPVWHEKQIAKYTKLKDAAAEKVHADLKAQGHKRDYTGANPKYREAVQSHKGYKKVAEHEAKIDHHRQALHDLDNKANRMERGVARHERDSM